MSQHIVQGSAEHVSSLLSGYGLGCPHYLVCSSGVSQAQYYPKRLGFFSSHNPDLIIFYVDTKNICSDCLKLFVPSGFNFWSSLPDPNGGGENSDSPPRKWLFPSGQAEHFINLRKIGGGASDPAIVPLPSSPVATTAWEWIKSQKKPFYIDQLHLAPRWSPVNERNALADSATGWRSGIAIPAPTVATISAPTDNKKPLAKAPKPSSSNGPPSKLKTSADAIDIPGGKKLRKSKDPEGTTGAQAVSLSTKRRADGAVVSKPVSEVEPGAKQNGQGPTSSKEQISLPRKEKVKSRTIPALEGESKPVKAGGSSKMASPPVSQYTLSTTEESKPQREQERPYSASPVVPGAPIRRKAVGATNQTSNSSVEITRLDFQEIDPMEKANSHGKEAASGLLSLLSKPSPGHQSLETKTKSPKEGTASIKSKSTITTKEVHAELKTAEPSKESSKKKSSKAKPVDITNGKPTLVKTVEHYKGVSSQTIVDTTYTRSWYNYDPFSFDGAMTLSKLSDYKRRARTVDSQAERAPELPLETFLRETQPLDKSETLSGLKTQKTLKKEDPFTALVSPAAKDKRPSKLPLGSAFGMKAVLEAESSSGKKSKPSSAEGPVKSRSDKVSSTKPMGETLSEWTKEVQKVAKRGKTEHSGRSFKDKDSKAMKNGGKVTRSQPKTKTSSTGFHLKGRSSHGGHQSSPTVAKDEHIHHKQSKKKINGLKHGKPEKKPNTKPESNSHIYKHHRHEDDTHGSDGHDSTGEQPTKHQQPEEQLEEQLEEQQWEDPQQPGEQLGEHGQPGQLETPCQLETPGEPDRLNDHQKPSENQPLSKHQQELGEHEQPGEPEKPNDHEQPGEHKQRPSEHSGADPSDIGPTESTQSAAQPTKNSATPNSPVESNTTGTDLEHKVSCAPQPASSAQQSMTSLTDPNSRDPSSAGITGDVQSQPATPQTLGTSNIQETISGNESSPTGATTTAAVTVAVTSGTSLCDTKPDPSSLNKSDPQSTLPSNSPQEATVAGSGSAQGYYEQSTSQSVQNVQAQVNFISDPIQGSRGGLDGNEQSTSGEQRPSTPSSKLPSGAAFIAGTGIAGAAVLTGYLAATNASSSSNTSDADDVHSNSSREDPAGHWDDEFDRVSGDHQQPEPDNSDIDGVHGALSVTSRDGEEASEQVAEDDNMSQPDSLIHYREVGEDLFSSFDAQNDLHEHQLQGYENSDNETSHEAMEGHSYKQSSEDGEDDEQRSQQHHSESQEEFDNSADFRSDDGQSASADFPEQSDDNQQGEFALDSYLDVNSHHSAESGVLSQDEDQDQDNNSSDDGFENESDNGGSDQGSNTDSEQSIQDDTKDDSDHESSQEDSGQSDSEEAEDSDQSEEDDSDHISDDDDESDPQPSHSSEDDADESSEVEDDEITEEEQSEPGFDDSEPESEDVSGPEQGMYSDSGEDGNAYYSD
ncbi:Gram-positive signal peptide YSIRK family [Fusarium denticulatum]|uniref:Gram-positive signal peptide YSIRK family n=1 Tax=Fusarium denticulatum TaxID=48507 RepID=A0A8H5XIA4_9HYPO|nr:Gram-positive signal peptide YSIRK family [Fusarium denticulatum]